MQSDIQGLRAIAVLLVLAFHLWPNAVTGGYVGVDVFFVISGYLMTGILLREHEITGSINLSNFFARRIRRLVPAAAVVIICVAVAAPLLPATRWTLTAYEILASAFFVENWLLASRAVDYLAQDEAPGILQHYWSLGVEGQFYLFWPLMMIAGFYAVRVSNRKVGLAAFIAAIIVVFLALSIWLTYKSPARAYFATETRVWEFAIGGFVAAMQWRGKVTGAIGAVGALTGILAVFSAGLLFSPETLFPGWVALLPCGGAALLIICGQKGPVAKILSCRPAVFLGDISYSVYLWHWPLIVFWASGFPDIYGSVAKVAIIILSITLAIISKFFIEDPLRQKRPLSWAHQSLISGAAIAALAAVTAVIPLNMVASSTSSVATVPVSGAHYPGAAVLTGHATLINNPPPFIPQPRLAKRDMPVANKDGCQIYQADKQLKSCEYGRSDGSPHFVLVGDSHAAQFSEAFKLAAEQHGWRYTHMSKAQCPFMDETIRFGRNRVAYESCDDWNDQAMAAINSLKPEYVIIAQTWRYRVYGNDDPTESAKKMRDGIERRFSVLKDRGIKIIAMKDIPFFEIFAPDCLAEGRTDCSRPRSAVFPKFEPIIAAAKASRVPIVDLSDAICGPETCEPIVGNILAWRDSNHLTATYSRTLAPALGEALEQIFISQ